MDAGAERRSGEDGIEFRQPVSADAPLQAAFLYLPDQLESLGVVLVILKRRRLPECWYRRRLSQAGLFPDSLFAVIPDRLHRIETQAALSRCESRGHLS